MLRHWDTAGLLVPAHVDEFSGYRSYDPAQLALLHRIVALRQLGFGFASYVGPTFDAMAGVIGDEPGALATPIAQYSAAEDGIGLTVGYAYAGPARQGFDLIDLPAAHLAVCGIHLGSMDRIDESWTALHAEILARGFLPAGSCASCTFAPSPMTSPTGSPNCSSRSRARDGGIVRP